MSGAACPAAAATGDRGVGEVRGGAAATLAAGGTASLPPATGCYPCYQGMWQCLWWRREGVGGAIEGKIVAVGPLPFAARCVFPEDGGGGWCGGWQSGRPPK